MENDPNAPQNYQLPQTPTVLPPASFQVPPEPQKLLDKLKNNKPIIAGAISLLLLVTAGGLLLVRNDKQSGAPGNGKNAAEVVFKDWLKPSSEIKVGNNRYVSTCQVLPVATVVDTMYNGKPPEAFVVNENYYDSSPAQQKYSRPRTHCYYGDAVTLRAEQYFDAADVKRVSDSVSQAGVQYLDAKVAAYKLVAEASGDQALKEYVSKIESSAKTYKEKKDSYSRSATENLNTDTLIIPTGNNAIEFTLFSNNVIYELALPSKLRASGIATAPSDQLLTQLKQAKELTDIIYKNIKNTQLSQSPGPTVLSDKAKVGQTYVLEPCAVLTAAITKSITGIDQANVIDRRSVIYDLNAVRTAKAGHAIFPTNECSRTVKQGTDIASNNTKIQLELEYATDSAALDKKLKDGKYLPLDADDTQLQTTADFAAEFAVDGFEPYYQFRVGSYWAYLKITTIQSNGTQGQLSREQHVAAINMLADSLKANLKEAETNQGR